MKTLVIYISVHHSNTEKVAKVMANVLDAGLLQVKQVYASMLEQYDLIGFGSGIYFGKYHRSLLGFADTLPTLRNKKAFIFSTSGLRKMRFIHDFNKPLKEKLQRKGFDVIGEFSCRGFDTSWAAMIVGGINKGRPNARDLKQAEDFARALRDSRAIRLKRDDIRPSIPQDYIQGLLIHRADQGVCPPPGHKRHPR